MSILNVEHLSHGFGDRAIFEDVSFRLLKGEHIGLVGANGEGKSTFMNIITGRLMPDEGKIEWAKKVRVGYLDQHTALEKGMTIGSVLSSAFDFLYDMENEMNDIYARLGDVDEDEMNKLMEEAGTIQDMLTMHDFYMIDAKVEEVARALGLLDLGLDKDVTDLSGGQRTKVLMGKLLLEKPDILLLDEPTNYLDVEHIEWLKRYLNDYENAFILISHDIPFLNSVVNLIYHMDNKKLDRYVGDYDKFMEVYEMKKAQLEAAYNKQQQEIKEHLSHGFGDRAIFEDVSFRLLKGEHIGLVGANGEGKSTFMNIITGRLMPDEGKIEWAKKVRVGYLDQHTALEKGMTIGSVLSSAFDFLYDMENEMNDIYARLGDVDEDEMNKLMEEAGTIQDMLTMHDFYMIDAKVEEVARALGLLDLGLDKDVTDLSGGQRTKVLMGKLLLEKPDILLLDEPTNYLDVEHIEWLKRYLNDYENAFILISHDIPFLNSVVNLIYHMDNKKLDRYVGDYDKFMEVYEMKKAQLEAAYNKQQQEIKELKDFVARNKARVATRNMAMSRQKKLDKMDVIELAAEKPKPEFNFKTARTPGRYIFQTNGLVIGYDDPLSSALDLEMERGQKIVLTGANGIGKTTLLKSILGLIKPLSGSVTLGDYLEIGYFEQEMDQSVTTTCIEEIWNEFPAFSQYEVRSALAKCGLTTKHIESQVRVLSGGEQAKVRLCKLINRETNILLLDEPTNHLDVDAKDELKRALKEYKGSILMVCHEPDFYDGLATDVWDCSKWTTRL